MTTKKKTPAKKAAPKTSKKPASPASPGKRRAPKLSLEELQAGKRTRMQNAEIVSPILSYEDMESAT